MNFTRAEFTAKEWTSADATDLNQIDANETSKVVHKQMHISTESYPQNSVRANQRLRMSANGIVALAHFLIVSHMLLEGRYIVDWMDG